ncbi:hypothetical protein IG631_22125 [Alternaria alternata]|nr:hypothetical protein IG631_22125 [Alternaria alternata]
MEAASLYGAERCGRKLNQGAARIRPSLKPLASPGRANTWGSRRISMDSSGLRLIGYGSCVHVRG